MSLVLPPIEVPVEPRGLVRGRARDRARFVGAMLTLALTAVALRGFQLCVDPADRVVRAGSMQRYDQVTLDARRGQIVDRNGHVLATSVDTPSVAADPSLVDEKDIPVLAARVSHVLGLPMDEVEEKLRRKTRYVKLASRVHPEAAAEIEALDVAAVFTHDEPHRFYPEEGLGAQLVGFVDSEGVGEAGLESSLDRYLRGGAVLVQRMRDRKGLDVDRPAVVDQDQNRGQDVHLTLDRSVQRIAERALDDVMVSSAPLGASALVVDVHTGDILALANGPGFNPNAVATDSTGTKNHIVTDAIEPGSVFKPFTVSAAVEEKLVTRDSLIDCEGGGWSLGRARIHDDHPHGVLTIGEVLKYSSNIGAAKLALRLGADTFLSYVHRFGFGEQTGIPLPGERFGRVRDARDIKPIELATTAFGQGVTATPLQLVMAVATIANDGIRMKPRLVTSVEDSHGVPQWIQKPEVAERVISAETAHSVAEMMSMVTEEGGTGTRARIDGYKVAGKTGTAQKVKDGHYSDARVSSFVGFVPADRPVVAIAVVVDEPSIGSKYGGLVAAPAFSKIASETLRYLGVPPDPDADDDAKKPVKADPVAETPQPIALVADGDGWILPDLTGRPMREVLVALQSAGFALKINGTGSAFSQTPPAGSHVAVGGDVVVEFR